MWGQHCSMGTAHLQPAAAAAVALLLLLTSSALGTEAARALAGRFLQVLDRGRYSVAAGAVSSQGLRSLLRPLLLHAGPCIVT